MVVSGNTVAAEPSRGTTSKVIAATAGSALGGAFGTVAVYFANAYVFSGHPIPDAVQSALVALISAVAAFGLGYLKSPAAGEAVAVSGRKAVSARITGQA